MYPVVLTVDQRASRTRPDLVRRHWKLSTLNSLRAFERTAGDEIQGVFDASEVVVQALTMLLRSSEWNIGIGIGPVEMPLPPQARAGRGAAYLQAREAVNRAKQVPAHISVVGVDSYRAEQLETVLWLWADLLRRRSARGWEVADLIAGGYSHSEAGTRLGVTQSAVSQRARAASVVEADRAARLARQLITENDDGRVDLMVVLSLALLVLANAAVIVAWLTSHRAPQLAGVLSSAVLLVAVTAIGVVHDTSDSPASWLRLFLLAATSLLAIGGGGPLTAAVFGLVDGRDAGGGGGGGGQEDARGSMAEAGHVLRGGAWIGVLERAAVFATLMADWPEGLAVILGLKGLGRYPELRSGHNSGTAERFIIGTFTSILWAAACAGAVLLVL